MLRKPAQSIWEDCVRGFAVTDYARKRTVLSENGVALWDVITACESDGALDSSIRNPVYNTGVPEFINYHKINKVCFNGGNAYTFYRRGIGLIEKNVLPSTSPAHAAMRFEEKLRIWRETLMDS